MATISVDIQENDTHTVRYVFDGSVSLAFDSVADIENKSQAEILAGLLSSDDVQLQSRTTRNEDDELDGWYEQYHENGRLSFKGKFQKGLEIGLWEYYHANGQLQQLVNYSGENGEYEALATFDRRGNPVENRGTYKTSLLQRAKELSDIKQEIKAGLEDKGFIIKGDTPEP